MIGKLLYRYRTQFGHGFRIAWQRDVVRWRVLKTPPVYPKCGPAYKPLH